MTTETGRVEIVEETGEPIATINVAIIEITDANNVKDGPHLALGFYFSFPRLGDDMVPVVGGEIPLHGPYETREDALEEAGSFLIEAAESQARFVLANDALDNQEIAA
jgi:hypothetical protein